MMIGPMRPARKAPPIAKPPAPGSRATKPGTQVPTGIAAMPRKPAPKPLPPSSADMRNGYSDGQKIRPDKPKPTPASLTAVGGVAKPKAEY